MTHNPEIAEALDRLDHTGLREWALDPDASREERLVAARRYNGVLHELRALAHRMQDETGRMEASAAYAKASAADPKMTEPDTARLWARASAADIIYGLLGAVSASLPYDGDRVLRWAGQDDPADRSNEPD